jgi:tetratricopeptide (TPR) repeat protein
VDLRENKSTRQLIYLALALVTIGIYWQVHGFDFINYDDPDYVTQNTMVKAGVTFKGILWAFTHTYASNWHPLTWISHMIDCQLFGLHAGGPHMVNVLFHTANALLLFLLLYRLTGAQWRSAIVAGLFAWHPLHVESVAWISERKDVLSTFFGLLSLLAYVRHVKESSTQIPKSKAWYIWALIFFALSLMAKPMLVTLPCLMLLLDFWPLQRIENAGWRTFVSRPFILLVREKWPWFLLVVVSVLVTLRAQVEAMVPTAGLPLLPRLLNATQSYFWYLEKLFWPANLTVFYPMDREHLIVRFAAGTLVLVLISGFALATIKRRPFFIFGWLWFVGTLIPVIGIVQVGAQSRADRYGYIPSIGIFIAVVWLAYEFLKGSKQKLAIGGVAVGIVCISLAATTVLQARYWKNTITLFSHALDVTNDNDIALNILGMALFDEGRYSDALKFCRLAIAINPGTADFHKNLGLVLAKTGKPDDALHEYEEAVRLEPKKAEFQIFLAETLATRGKNEEALIHFEEAARLKPENAIYQNDLAVALVALGKRAEAMPHYLRAVQLEPSNAKYQNNFATALVRAGDPAAAEQHYRAAIKNDPTFAESHSNLGALLFIRQQFSEAAAQYSDAIRLNPTNAGIRFNAALAFLKVHRTDEALAQFNEASRLRPDWAEPLNAEAWTLATSNDEKVRNGAEAVKLAEKAAEISSRQVPAILNTLAAAYAEVGRFDDAIATATQAVELAKHANQTNLVAKIERALTLYKAHTPLRE